MTSKNWHQLSRDTNFCIRNVIEGRSLEYSNDGSANGEMISKYSARNGRLLYQFPVGSEENIDQAVTSARQAFDDGRWHTFPCYKRKTILQNLASLIETHKETFALYESLDVGKPIASALNGDIGMAAGAFRSSAEKVDKLLSVSGSDGGHLAFQRRKPVGVVGGITGWNYPLVLAAQKAAFSLATGNSLVLKPSEFTALSAGLLAELALEAGVPPGVFNVVHGAGRTVGAALAEHHDVDLRSFVGSSATGKRLMTAAGKSNMKRLILECGGKSPYLVFNDCTDDLDALAADIVGRAFPNQGALCVAATRLLIQHDIKDQLLPKILEHTAKIKPADPLDSRTTFGALVNEAHMKKVLAYIEGAKKEGAKLIYGGQRVHPESDQAGGFCSQSGFYVEPTVFDNVKPHHTIFQEEIFGPVLSITSFDTEDEAIALANNSDYGLAAYAATTNLACAQRLGQKLNVGTLTITGSSIVSGGYVDIGAEKHRQSGFGYLGGIEGLSAHTVATTVRILT